jgi:hypothetical protein
VYNTVFPLCSATLLATALKGKKMTCPLELFISLCMQAKEKERERAMAMATKSRSRDVIPLATSKIAANHLNSLRHRKIGSGSWPKHSFLILIVLKQFYPQRIFYMTLLLRSN